MPYRLTCPIVSRAAATPAYRGPLSRDSYACTPTPARLDSYACTPRQQQPPPPVSTWTGPGPPRIRRSPHGQGQDRPVSAGLHMDLRRSPHGQGHPSGPGPPRIHTDSATRAVQPPPLRLPGPRSLLQAASPLTRDRALNRGPEASRWRGPRACRSAIRACRSAIRACRSATSYLAKCLAAPPPPRLAAATTPPPPRRSPVRSAPRRSPRRISRRSPATALSATPSTYREVT